MPSNSMPSKLARRLSITTILWLFLSATALATPASIQLDVRTERADAMYQVGDEVKFFVRATSEQNTEQNSEQKPLTEGTVKYVLSKDGVNPFAKGTVELGSTPAVITGTMNEPGFLRCKVSYQPAKVQEGQKKSTAITALAGAAISPEKITKSLPVPDDFDAFWTTQKKRLTDVPIDPTLTPVDSGSENLECFDVQINCPGGTPVSGYFGRPKGAKPKSLPIVLWVQGAGVYSSSLHNAQKAERLGMLSMDINAHGIPNGKPKSFYEDLARNELSGYPQRGREDRETLYFNGMFLRLLRAIDFLTSQPEWDGKTLIVAGHSQGGAQALAAAGLDPRVTFIAAGVPAMCDHSGMVVDRVAGWPRLVPFSSDKKPGQKPNQKLGQKPNKKLDQKILQVARYYDVVNFAARTKADAILSVGFIDVTCPPTTCYAAFNQLRGKKTMINEPPMGHAAPPHIHTAFEKAILAHAKERSGK